jgi:hypothetical protein
VQLGPRIPVLTGAGLGYAALGLVGWSLGRVHLAFNGGFLTDPGLAIAYGHPTGAVLGIDAVVAIDSRGHYALTSEIGGTALGDGRGEAHQTIGFAWEPFPDRLQFSVVFLTGISPSPDRGAFLFGMSPKVNLW